MMLCDWEYRRIWCCLRVILCYPYLSTLEAFVRRRAIQIHVYLSFTYTLLWQNVVLVEVRSTYASRRPVRDSSVSRSQYLLMFYADLAWYFPHFISKLWRISSPFTLADTEYRQFGPRTLRIYRTIGHMGSDTLSLILTLTLIVTRILSLFLTLFPKRNPKIIKLVTGGVSKHPQKVPKCPSSEVFWHHRYRIAGWGTVMPPSFIGKTMF